MVQPALQQEHEDNVGKKFFNLVDRHFPAGSKLRKIFNRNTIKISYSYVRNIRSVIKHRNTSVLKIDSMQKPKTSSKDLHLLQTGAMPLGR